MHIEKLLCTSLKMVFDAFPLNARTTPRDIILLHTKFVKLIKKHLAVVTAPQNSLDITSANLMISSAVSAIKTLAKGKKDFVDYFMMPLIGVLQRFTKEIRMLTRSIANQVRLTLSFICFFIKCFILFLNIFHAFTCLMCYLSVYP
jgi:hypothetical protein